MLKYSFLDKANDISILKIEDKSFTNFAQLPYAVKTPILDVGTSVFALGYPMSDILGEEIKSYGWHYKFKKQAIKAML